MALFYNAQQSIWPGLPQMARPYPQGDSQQFAGTSPMMGGPVTPPPASTMRRGRENWTGLPEIQKYGR